jgi:exopolyphosphatase/pppGpp-phosphohydrolase
MKILVLPILLMVFSCSTSKKTGFEHCFKNKTVAEIGTNRITLLMANVDVCQKKIVKEIYKQDWPIEQDKSVFLEHDGTQALSHETKDKILFAFEEIKLIFEKFKVINPDVVATGVFREVTNADLLFNKIQNIIGTYPRLLSVLEEAQIGLKSLQTVESTLPGELVLWDIGESSSQITVRVGGKTRYILGGHGSQYYKSLAIQVLKKRLTPNPIKQSHLTKVKNAFKKSTEEYLRATPDLPEGVTVYGIGGVHSKSILDMINSYHETKNNFYTLEELRQLIVDSANLTDGQLAGAYASNRVTNAMLAEVVMDYLQIDRVDVREIDLTTGLLLFGPR